MQPRTIAIAIAVVIIFIIIIVAVLKMSSQGSQSLPNTIPNNGPNTVTPQPVSSTPPAPVHNMGVWLRNPGGGYVSGLSYADSSAYCIAQGGRLATKSEIDAAGAKLNFCAAGWFQGPDQGWYSNGTDIAGCGGVGWHTLTDAPVDKKLGTFCYGQIPSDSAIVASAILS